MSNRVACMTCGTEVHRWRACPIIGCNVIIAYCSKCGGDLKSKLEMTEHIHHEKWIPCTQCGDDIFREWVKEHGGICMDCLDPATLVG